jgi:hypothetical protein
VAEISGNTGNLRWKDGVTFWAGYGDLTPSGGWSFPSMGSSQVNDYVNFQTWTDISYNGLVLYGVRASGTMSQGQICFMDTNGKWEIVGATSNRATKLLGICLRDADPDETTNILLNGIYCTPYHEQQGSSSQGVPLYISAATDGSVDQNAPSVAGEYVRLIGHNICEIGGQSLEVIRFDPDNTWILL